MTVDAVTFDCAQTLIAVDWRPAMLAVECAQRIGLAFDGNQAAVCYDRLLRNSWPEFQEINLRRDEGAADGFWHTLTHAWAEECGFPVEAVEDLVAEAEQRLFGQPSSVFSLYDDVFPCLDRLRDAGVPMAVVSNWDISLRKTLRAFGLAHYFSVIVASMEEGFEKPDPRIFQVALSQLGVEPSRALHVGDNPLDDLRGAKSAGMQALIIDRGEHAPAQIYVDSLMDIPARIGL